MDKTVEDVYASMRATSLKLMFGYDIKEIQKIVKECCDQFCQTKTYYNDIIKALAEQIKNKIGNTPSGDVGYPFQINVDVKAGYTDCDLKVVVEFLIDRGNGLSLREEVEVKYNKQDILQSKESLRDYYSSGEFLKTENIKCTSPADENISKHEYIMKHFDFDLNEIEHRIKLCYQSFMWNNLPTLEVLIRGQIWDIPHQSDCKINVEVTEDNDDIIIKVLLSNMWDKSINESFTVTYKSDTLTKLRSAYYNSEEYVKNTISYDSLPDKTDMQFVEPVSVKPKTSTYDYDEIKDIVFNVCSNNLDREGEKVTLTELSHKIFGAIKPLMKKSTDTLHVWTEYVGAFTDIGVHSKIGDIAIHVDIFETPFGKLYNFVFTTKQTIKQEEKVKLETTSIPKYGLPKYSEFESTWEPKVNIENTSTNKNYKEHVSNIIHKVAHEQSWYFLDRTQRLEKISALISLYMESFTDVQFTEITDEDSSLLHDYIYNVTFLDTKTNVSETIRVAGRFERQRNKWSTTDLEQNWLEQEEIPLKVPTKQPTSYDGSDVHYNSYCRVKKLYAGYGCGQPNEKIEIEPKENTNYPAFLNEHDMGVLRTLIKVFLLSGDTLYDDYVCEQARQILIDKKIKIVRKHRLEDCYFYVSNIAESVWSKVSLLELVKPTIEKQVTKTVNIDYEQLQILIKSYNDNGGNIMYHYDSDRLVDGIISKILGSCKF